MADENILGNSQAVNQFVQQQTKHIEGQPVRVYPFKIVSGLSYFTNKGQKPLGSNPGNTWVAPDNTAKNNDYGAYTGVTTMFSGAKPLICYWFGVTNIKVGDNGYGEPQSNLTTEYLNVKWVNPVPLTNGTDIPSDSLFAPKQFKNPFENNQLQWPWKELGLQGYSVSSGKDQQAETLDNLKIACYETTYDYTMYSTSWVPNFQQINEFVYFIVDVRCACPLALRITSVEPHYDAVGILQDCTINFTSINQYYNNSGRNVLTYVKFGAIGDDYAFPQEIWYTDPNDETATPTFMTVLNPNLFMNSMGGVNQIEVKNNSLTGQFGALVYGHPYTPFIMVYNEDGSISIQKTWYADDYLIPWRFTAPCQDLIDVSSENVHTSYDLAMNMLVINEQLWANWKSTKEYYNMTQNFTFQGGLAFDDPTLSKQQVTENGDTSVVKFISTLFGVERNVYQQTFGTNNYDTWSSNAPGMQNLGRFTKGYGSKNIANVILSNANGSTLAQLSNPNNTWYLTRNPSQAVTGFALPSSGVFDFRGTGFTGATWWTLTALYGTNAPLIFGAMQVLGMALTGLEFAQKSIDLYYDNQFQPPNTTDSEILSLDNFPTGMGHQSITPEKFFALNSWSMINTHQLEINYRDGINYTNRNQGHHGVANEILDAIGDITDAFGGYTPGYCNFFMNTYARTYNVLLPHMITMLAEQYINPTDAVYNAIPLDIFANTNQNNTSVGQLKYLSGYQYILTNWFTTNQATPMRVETTTQMRYADLGTNSDGSNVTRYVNPQDPENNGNGQVTGDTITINRNGTPVPVYKNKQVGVAKIPYNSVIYFNEPAEPLTTHGKGHTSFVIDAINVKQLGVSNLHITYWKEVPTGDAVNNTQEGQAYSSFKLESVGEEWLENTAKMMNNTSYIDNYVSYNVYDEINTSMQDNCEPYLAFQFPADPMVSLSLQQIEKNAIGDSSKGMHYIKLLPTAPVKGINFVDNTNGYKPNSIFLNSFGGDFQVLKTVNGYNHYVAPFTIYNSFQSQYDPSIQVLKATWTDAGNWYADYPTTSGNQSYGSTIYTGIYWPSSTDKYDASNTKNGFASPYQLSYSYLPTSGIPTFAQDTVSWWQNLCLACSDSPDKDGYLNGRLDYFALSTQIATIQVSNGWTTANATEADTSPKGSTNVWLGNMPIIFPCTPKTGPHTSLPCAFIGGYDGLIQPYSFECFYYSANFMSMINQDMNYWSNSVPSNNMLGSNENCNWNYVLIPHGANPEEYQTADANDYPWVNSQNAVIVMEAGNNNVTGKHNNVVLYQGSYQGAYTPNYNLTATWYGAQPVNTDPYEGENDYFYGVYGCLGNNGAGGGGGFGQLSTAYKQGNINYTFQTYTTYSQTNSAQGTYNNNASTKPYWFFSAWSKTNFPLTPSCPYLPFQQLGLGASYVYAKTVPSYGTFNVGGQTPHNFIGSVYNTFSGAQSPDGANPYVLAPIQIPLNSDSMVGNPWILRAQPDVNSIGLGWPQNTPVPAPINPGSNDWANLMWTGFLIQNQSEQGTDTTPSPTYASGEYDLYIFYSIYVS